MEGALERRPAVGAQSILGPEHEGPDVLAREPPRLPGHVNLFIRLQPIDVKHLDALFPHVTSWAMSKPDTERVLTPMPTSLVEAIDDYRYSARVPSRSEAIRRLLAAGLKAEQARAASLKADRTRQRA